MNNFFCAEESCQAKEDPIGCALHRRYYVLVEFPPPWSSNPLDSKSLPSKLQALKDAVDEVSISLRLVFIYNRHLYEIGRTRLIIFQETTADFPSYHKQEFLLSDINEVVPILEKCIRGENLETEDTNTRDILICTHGSHDKCCAKYGNPFYRQAIETLADLSLPNIRIWQSSHFGGHRFAPTMIDLPEGRYYGRLDKLSFAAILTRNGDIYCLKNVYRGLGTLPWQVQTLERELIFKYGWNWFNYQVRGHVIKQNEDETFNQIEINFKKPDGEMGIYRANVIEDKSKNLIFRGECDNDVPSNFPQFIVTNIVKL